MTVYTISEDNLYTLHVCGHLRSRDKDGGDAFQSVTAENPMAHTNLVALSFIEREL